MTYFQTLSWMPQRKFLWRQEFLEYDLEIFIGDRFDSYEHQPICSGHMRCKFSGLVLNLCLLHKYTLNRDIPGDIITAIGGKQISYLWYYLY